MVYWELFVSFFQVGLFSIGGGYAALPLIQYQIVDYRGWLTLAEFADVITISQMTPGPIALNSAAFVGIQIAGIPGAVVANIGCVLPSCTIVYILARIYLKYKNLTMMQGVLKGLRPAVVALIASAAVSIIKLAFLRDSGLGINLQNVEYINIALFAVCFFIIRKWKPDPIIVMICAGVMGFFAYSFIA